MSLDSRISVDASGALELDAETGLERNLTQVAILFFVGAVILFLSPGSARQYLVAGWLLVSGLGATITRLALDDRYLLDISAQRVLFVRKLFGLKLITEVCRFSDLAAVALFPRSGRNKYEGRFWEYGLCLVRNDGTLVHVLPPTKALCYSVTQQGRELSEKLGRPFHAGDPTQTLTVKTGPLGPEISYRSYTGSNAAMLCLVAASFLVPMLLFWLSAQPWFAGLF